ncbi:CoA pyrophosphatase [Vibrio sp. S9_S30]|uniref:CoA pyrophosphatase n=1 Tax=Vibrio sp. S9_S30 TaxID=2720226 RepID=UPI001681758C|nr:CoA pyrophosphatase [Vibrio sp. S9_S30]MBD1558353.1 CoA pyrophosphatase [Vibrio sp. S9_S30]
MDKDEFLKRFLFTPPLEYHRESFTRHDDSERDTFRTAAVLIGLVERETGLNMILTRRASHLRHHPGQISFPGGKTEKGDTSPFETAMREANEEIGLAASQIHHLGQLNPIKTISGFEVTPVIAFADNRYQAQTDPNEVDFIFEAPIEYLFKKSNIHALGAYFNGSRRVVYSIPFESHLIWGVTAQIIHTLHTQFIR